MSLLTAPIPDVPLPRVRCALCDKLVERVVVSYEVATMCHVISVKCHGDSESMRMEDYLLADLGVDVKRQILSQEGVAFGARRLPPARFNAPDSEE